MHDIARNLKRLRRQKGLTQEELAIRLNYNGPSGVERAFKRVIPKLKQHVHGGVWPDIQRPLQKAQQEFCYCTPQETWIK